LGGHILFRGILFGNALGLLLIWLQSMVGFLKLPQDKYYLSEVPLGFEWGEFLIINIITIALALFVLFMTSLFVANIKPVKAIKFN
jgi:lipoprotein-releasing system permease protein